MQAGFLQKNLYSTDISSKFSRFLCQISKWQGQALWKEIHILYFCLDALINFSKEISFPQDADFYKLTLADCDPKVWRTNIVGYPQRRLFFCYITLREEFWMCLAASWPPPALNVLAKGSSRIFASLLYLQMLGGRYWPPVMQWGGGWKMKALYFEWDAADFFVHFWLLVC